MGKIMIMSIEGSDRQKVGGLFGKGILTRQKDIKLVKEDRF